MRQFLLEGEFTMSDLTGTLYLVATPIGNLSDISARAVKTLREADFIAAEDTRVTRKILTHLEIKKPLVSYYKHNSRTSGDKILSRIKNGENCALVTDAGTPGISDPGEDLVRLCAGDEIPVIVIPGPCAAVVALSLSGLGAERFSFEGFLSADSKKRKAHLEEIKSEKRTMVFYEAPHKLLRTMKDLLKTTGDRRVSISRELTKIYEETLRMTLSEAIEYFENKPPRGEFVLVVEGLNNFPDTDNKIEDGHKLALKLIKTGLSARDAVKKAADETGCGRNALYKIINTR